MSTSSSRRTHRKRVSALHLSSDTTATLPEYIPVAWNRPEEEDLPSDKPPDYPDSAEEADEDTDSDGTGPSAYVPPLPSLSGPVSPRRARRLLPHRRRQSTNSNSPYLDSLLARSVHALEMSNTLLQSSMSTQTSLSAVLASDSQADRTLETSARGLSSRIRGSRRVHETWVGDLEEISREVEGLFQDNGSSSGQPSHSVDSPISSSLPTTSPIHRYRRRPSLLDLRDASKHRVPHLHLSQQDRSDLISPPPRALTQYVASTSESDLIILPSTLGLRAPSSSHSSADWWPVVETSSTSLHGSPSSPRITDRPLDPSTPAYSMLSSFIYRAPSPGSSAPSSFRSSRPSLISNSRHSSRNTSTSTERTNSHSKPSPSLVAHKSPDKARSDLPNSTSRSSRSESPKSVISPLPHRPMTPPTEESSSSDGCPAKLTVLSLRKILDDQPPPPSNTPPEPPPSSLRPRPPAFLPRTPAPVAEAGTSTATASVSRLFTKPKHSSSTRPPSPPRQSAMKQPSPASTTPSPSPTNLNIPDFFGAGVAKALGSTPSSGRSTPKRISFAELPESYASSRPEGSYSKFKDKKSRRRKQGGGAAAGSLDRGNGKGKEGSGEGGWWTGWLMGASGTSGAHGAGMSALRHEERMEDRVSRTWGGRMGVGFGPGLDEWAV